MKTRDENEERLLARAREGDRDSLELLLEHLAPRLLRFSSRMCRHNEDAQDVVQDSLLAVARTIGGFRGDAALSTWLYTIARSFCIKKRRRSKFAPQVVSLDSEAPQAFTARDPGGDPHHHLETRRLRQALDGAIGGLAPAYRDVLLLRDIEGLPAEQAASVLGVSVPALKSRLHRARASIKEQLEPVIAPGQIPSAPPCPNIVGMLSRHLEGEISPKTCAAMEAHLDRCPHCRSSCDTLRRALRLCQTTPLPRVPKAMKSSIHEALIASPLASRTLSPPAGSIRWKTKKGRARR